MYVFRILKLHMCPNFWYLNNTLSFIAMHVQFPVKDNWPVIWVYMVLVNNGPQRPVQPLLSKNGVKAWFEILSSFSKRWFWSNSGCLSHQGRGPRLTLHWSQALFQVGMDCAKIITFVKVGPGDRSKSMHEFAEIVHLLNERNTEIHKIISHGQNKVGHVMAAIGRTQLICLHMLTPEDISIIIIDDCKTVIAWIMKCATPPPTPARKSAPPPQIKPP